MQRLLVGVVLLASPTLAQQPGADQALPFTWRGRIAEGAWLRVHNANGTVEVIAASGPVAEVQGDYDRGGRRSGEGRLVVVQDGADVVVCVLPDDRGTCGPRGISMPRNRGHDRWMSATVTVQVPQGVRLAAHSGNGAVRVTGVSSEVEASSGNGAVTVENVGGPVHAHSGNGEIAVTAARGPVNAYTGNGAVRARMLQLPTAEDMEFRTGNGRVVVELPEGFQGLLEASTANGRVVSDFPITVQGRFSASRLNGTIGAGGKLLKLWSANGNLELRSVSSMGATPRP